MPLMVDIVVNCQTWHEPHTQLRYAATISTIKARNFIDFIIIQFYNNFKKLWKQLNKELSELPEDDPQGAETCRSKCSYIKD
jgi:hypothetical protein